MFLLLRGTRSTSSSPSGVDTWWDWSLTTLLDGLYRDGSPTAGSPGAQVGFALLPTPRGEQVVRSTEGHTVGSGMMPGLRASSVHSGCLWPSTSCPLRTQHTFAQPSPSPRKLPQIPAFARRRWTQGVASPQSPWPAGVGGYFRVPRAVTGPRAPREQERGNS